MEIKTVGLPLYLARRWMKCLGVVLIASGVVYALTIVGLLVAWLPIWLGVLLFQAANHANAGYTGQNEQSLTTALWKLKTFFLVAGVVALIYVVLFVLTAIGAIAMAFWRFTV